MSFHRSSITIGFALLWLGVPAPSAYAQEGRASLAERISGMERLDGFIPVLWEESTGKLYLEVPTDGREFIYVVSLTAGIGSNDIGLDRSQLGGESVVRFERVGPKVFLVEPNQRYRAVTDDPSERRAVEESFATSILWGFKVEAEEGNRVLVDASAFVLRDGHGVASQLQRSRQGVFRVDESRSAVYRPGTKVFPRNSEIEVRLTLVGDNPGGWVRSVVPTPEAITVRQRHSFVALPEPGFVARELDPRGGFFGMSYADYATPISSPLQKRFIARHRLKKRNPGAASSEPVEPIIYYVDPGAPEPVRSALLDGARWWNQAFEAAGYRNAFRVEVLPDGADPMDVRYNTIQWVHRSTRGWSYGSTVSDPRTGEIIKGHVSLGSLRVRQDYLIAEGLLSPYTAGEDRSPEAEAMALARIRQLSAHEVGHTLGLQHNYIASTQGRASVMDYPAPLARLGANGNIDLSDAYAVGIGEWDKVAITWGYQDFSPGVNQAAALEEILGSARGRGITFLTDQDARPTGSAHPQTHLWDNGVNAADELDRVMAVRRAAMNRFGESAIRRGSPLATIEEAFVPLYLHHRYQVEATVKVIGGQWYNYAMRGDGQEPLHAVSAADQNRALEAVLATITPQAVAIPRAILATIPPRPSGFPQHQELLDGETGLVFDALTPGAAAADFVVGLLLDPERAARMIQQHALDPSLPGLETLLGRVANAAFGATPTDPYHAELSRAVQRVVADRLMGLATNAGMPQVRAIAAYQLHTLKLQLEEESTVPVAEQAHRFLLASDIDRFMTRVFNAADTPRPGNPPGSPIGTIEPPHQPVVPPEAQ